MIQLLTRDFLIDSSLLIKECFENKYNVDVLITTNRQEIASPEFIRYGNSGRVQCGDTQYNSADFIKLCRDKLMFSENMHINGIYSPKYTIGREPRRDEYPVVVRKTLSGYGGDGIVVCKNREQFRGNIGFYWTPFVYCTREYRVHVLGGNIARLFIKEKDTTEEHPIRNQENGWHFEPISTDGLPGIKRLVTKLHSTMQGEMYSLDVGWDNTNRRYFVFEANSASGLNWRSAEIYVDFLYKKLCQEQ